MVPDVESKRREGEAEVVVELYEEGRGGGREAEGSAVVGAFGKAGSAEVDDMDEKEDGVESFPVRVFS